MVKNPSKSIFVQKCFKKTFLISGFICFLLLQGTFRVLAQATPDIGKSEDPQQIVITGTVTDESNNPMAGVNVLEKGTTNGVLTGANGKYSISVASQRSALVFSFIGFESQEINVGAETVVDVILKSSLTGLEEVVVIGYGTQRREAVTGSVASIGGEAIRAIPSNNFTQSVQGRLPGVELT